MYWPRATEASTQSEEEVAVKLECSGEGETILVVEDDTTVCEIVVHMLTDIGYAIVEAGDGKAALQALQEMTGIALLFTDIVLPHGMSGEELMRAARRR